MTSPGFCTTASERVYITASSGEDANGGSQGAVTTYVNGSEVQFVAFVLHGFLNRRANSLIVCILEIRYFFDSSPLK